MTGPDPGQWFWPDWHPHERVRAVVTTRHGAYSPPPWQGFNLGLNCGDEADRVRRARSHVHRQLATDHPPAWLQQVHGTAIVTAGADNMEADGVHTADTDWPCAVLTADCLPVLLARRDGTGVGAFHAGWRGLHGGILQRAVGTLSPAGEPLAAWLGPAICRQCYQVGDEIRRAFLDWHGDAAAGFYRDAEPGHWRMDLAGLASLALRAAGVDDIQGGDRCTVCENHLFYSFRHEGRTGRFASLVWLA